MTTATAELPPLKITLGADENGVFDAGLPVLAGEAVENLFGDARPAGRVGDLALFQAGDWLLGAATVPLTAGLEETAHRLYGNIFEATRGRHLARIWNYVPAINETGSRAGWKKLPLLLPRPFAGVRGAIRPRLQGLAAIRLGGGLPGGRADGRLCRQLRDAAPRGKSAAGARLRLSRRLRAARPELRARDGGVRPGPGHGLHFRHGGHPRPRHHGPGRRAGAAGVHAGKPARAFPRLRAGRRA